MMTKSNQKRKSILKGQWMKMRWEGMKEKLEGQQG